MDAHEKIDDVAMDMKETERTTGYKQSWLRIKWEANEFVVPFRLEPNGKLLFWRSEVLDWMREKAKRVQIDERRKAKASAATEARV